MLQTARHLLVALATCALPCAAWPDSVEDAAPPAAGGFVSLHSFASGTDGAYPVGGVVAGTDGAFYGVTASGGAHGGGTLFRATADGTVTVVHAFSGNSDGGGPERRPILGADGRLYGTTDFGGASGGGTVYRVDLDGTDFEVLYSAPPGIWQLDQLVQAPDGTLYGIAMGGGLGYGAIFSVAPDGSSSIVHEFAIDGSEGWSPTSIIVARDGIVWGTMYLGGPANGGIAWRLADDGTLQVMHNFTNANGRAPALWLESADGSFYGTTLFGGPYGAGTIFKLTPSGQVRVVHGFGGTAFEGHAPFGLMRGTNGAFYGVTQSGGKSGGRGTVYRLSNNGTLTTLHGFGLNLDGGVSPQSDALAVGADGDLYATCYEGGKPKPPDGSGVGTLFKVAP